MPAPGVLAFGAVGVKLISAKRLALQVKFREYDASGDGKLNHSELKRVLTAGKSTVTDAEVTRLFRMVDKNHDGSIDFDEFADFIFDQEIPVAPTPPEIEERFTELFGEEGMDIFGWQLMCSDCRFFDIRFRQVDAAPLFEKARPRGKKRMELAPFRKLLGYVADKRGMSPAQLHEQILKSRRFMFGGNRGMSPEPMPCWTSPGAATSGKRARSSSGCRLARDSRCVQDGMGAEEEDWGASEGTFAAFCKQPGSMDRSEFAKLCDACGFLDKSLQKADVDIMFSGVMTPQKRVDFATFKDLIRTVARRRNISIREGQWRVSCCNGPRRKAVSRPVSAAAACLTGELVETRRQRIKAESEGRLGEEMSWGWTKGTFEAFSEGTGGLVGTQFQKLCEQCGLFSRGFGKTEADIIFSNHLSKQRRVTFEQFKDVLRDVAKKKQSTIVEVQKLVGYHQGPKELESQADCVRLHDDVTGYTGAALARYMEMSAGS